MLNKHKKRKFSISIYFAVFIAIMIVTDKTGLSLLALMCVIIHECGHFLIFLIYRIPVKSVSLKLFGIEIEIENDIKLSYKQEFFIALGGCFANIVTAFICGVVSLFKVYISVEMIALFSILLATLNILPIGSLDGARGLNAVLCNKMTVTKAEQILNITSVIFMIPLCAMAIFVFIISNYNISLIIVAIYLAALLVIKRR